jgi:hypothetical protein
MTRKGKTIGTLNIDTKTIETEHVSPLRITKIHRFLETNNAYVVIPEEVMEENGWAKGDQMTWDGDRLRRGRVIVSSR